MMIRMNTIPWKRAAALSWAAPLCRVYPWAAAIMLFLPSLMNAWAADQAELPVAVIRGVEDRALRALLTELSVSMWQSPRPPASEMALRGRARRHKARLMQALESEGYYTADISLDIVWTDTARQAVFQVTPGPAYRFHKIDVVFQQTPDSEPLPPPPLRAASGLLAGHVARAQDFLDAEKRLRKQLADGGYPFATVYDRRAVVNHDAHTMNVTFFMALGPRLYFGPARIDGLNEVRAETVLRELPWREGALYQAALLDKAQERLQRSGLFSVVRLYPAPVDEVEGDRVPIVIETTERRHRTISLGLHYRTDEGAGMSALWEHRNFWNLGRRLRVQGELTELEQSLGATYEIPRFRRPDQTLTLHVKAAQLDPDAFHSRRFDMGAWVERTLTPEWSVGVGAALRLSQVRERLRTQQYYLISTPAQIVWDHRDDPMDSIRGWRIVNRVTPFVDVSGIDTYFLKNELGLSHYLPIRFIPGLTLATRLRLGVMGGAALSDMPADERFYAGGGGSIRGYAYQKVGPLDRDGDATGGRSLTDWAFELRKRLNQNFGVVAFVDGGMAHEAVYPDFKDKPQWGAGLGARYFTPIGPLRFDVAVPLNQRKDLDSSVQFYISIGQAF